MVAGKGWIALALTTFATWRPARVLLGAYLFGGVTMLQFHFQGIGVDIPSQFLTMLPYLATIVVLALISRNPAWIRDQHAGLAGQAVLSRLIITSFSDHSRRRNRMTDLKKRSMLKLATLSALAAAALVGCGKSEPPPAARAGAGARRRARAQARAAEDRLRLRRPGGRRRLDLRARQRPQGDREGIRRQGRDQLRREGARVGRRRARDPRHGGPGQQADLRHHLRLHGADAEGGGRQQGREVRARHRLQDGREPAHLRQPHLRGRVHGRRDRRQDDQDQHAGRGRARSRSPRSCATSTASRSARSR